MKLARSAAALLLALAGVGGAALAGDLLLNERGAPAIGLHSRQLGKGTRRYTCRGEKDTGAVSVWREVCMGGVHVRCGWEVCMGCVDGRYAWEVCMQM